MLGVRLMLQIAHEHAAEIVREVQPAADAPARGDRDERPALDLFYAAQRVAQRVDLRDAPGRIVDRAGDQRVLRDRRDAQLKRPRANLQRQRVAHLGRDLLRGRFVDHDLVRAHARHRELAPALVRHRTDPIHIGRIDADQPEGRLGEPRVEVAHRDGREAEAEDAVHPRIVGELSAQVVNHLIGDLPIRSGRGLGVVGDADRVIDPPLAVERRLAHRDRQRVTRYERHRHDDRGQGQAEDDQHGLRAPSRDVAQPHLDHQRAAQRKEDQHRHYDGDGDAHAQRDVVDVRAEDVVHRRGSPAGAIPRSSSC